MSLLLDALNKADQERKRNEATPGINSNHEQVNEGSTHKKSIVITAVLVAGFMMLLAAIYWLGQRSATPAVTTNTATATAQNSSPAKSQIESGKAASVVTQENVTQGAIAQEARAASQDIDTSEENVASLYQQNTPTQNTTVPLNTPVADAPVESAINSAANNSMTNATEQTPGTPTSINQFANLPDLHDLPTQVLGKIPSLNYSEHNYNNNGGSVKINGIIRHVNDQLPAGIVIDKILEDGMILHVDNYSFKMRALNSWINM